MGVFLAPTVTPISTINFNTSFSIKKAFCIDEFLLFTEKFSIYPD